ncbi:tripartite tricarboxylate transporter substrate-binding protein [Clostridium sp. AM58-1XD]|uniref:Bug family tripartite tricarboxylate transporter substrate binding protein n=1 Tax=Clostridium sp. AM58-1XD TaxID=2292307 RepID=UPI000E4BDBBB|nr:tripartite tricarboxylate transporter substrate-binding protein [Clostridium sp. AM58-1XD]RGZ01209.1 tripartite tricarboxylate transporter substrate binding protein [Clostridium sp. AM58-1XD]
MKKKIALVLAGMMAVSVLTACGGGQKAEEAKAPAGDAKTEAAAEGAKEAAASNFEMKDTLNWMVTSSPGGGSDIYTRMISDIMTKENLVNGKTIVVTNKTDGGGEIGRNEVANTKGKKADYTLCTFNSGDLMPMVQNTKNRMANFKAVALMAVDKQLIFKGEQTKYEDFAAAIEAAKAGTEVVLGGSKGDDVATYEAMLEEIGVSKDKMKYITYDSTGDAITAALGGHIEFVISKPAAASEYVEAGSLIPVVALATERYTGKFDAPTLSEIGDYENVEIPVWRGVVAPAAMSDEAVAFYSDALKKVSETDQWKNDYIDKNKLIPQYMNAAEATEFMTTFETDYLATLGK